MKYYAKDKSTGARQEITASVSPRRAAEQIAQAFGSTCTGWARSAADGFLVVFPTLEVRLADGRTIEALEA